MRGIFSDKRGMSHTSKTEGSNVPGSRPAGGYAVKGGQLSDRSDTTARRSNGGRWELRLGTLQVTVWLGLAIGACVGGYFVGFFSGRYVGFESARQGSAGESPKLPAPEFVADASTLNPNRVYDRLKEPAILPDSGGPRASAKVSDVVSASGDTSLGNPADSGDSAAVSAPNPPAAKRELGLAAAPEVEEDIFDDGDASDRVIIGSEGGLVEELDGKTPSSVRMLGGAAALKNQPAKGEASSAAAVLDARIANARAEVTQPVAVEIPEPPKKVVPETTTKAGETSALVKKVLPAGYFAQVAAPKKLNEAEAVAKKLKRSGFPVVVESASVNGQSFYRVLVGPEDNKIQAERLVSQLQSESYVASKPFIRKVK